MVSFRVASQLHSTHPRHAEALWGLKETVVTSLQEVTGQGNRCERAVGKVCRRGHWVFFSLKMVHLMHGA